MSFIVSASGATNIEEVGGKAAALSKLIEYGFQTAEFFVIKPTAFSHGKSGPVAAENLMNEVAQAISLLGQGPFAVRSSGRQEDGADHSHAGQFETVLNVAADGVVDAASRVWASGFSDTIKTYAARKTGADMEPPAIIVQTMIPADVAGVAFSANPLTGLRGHIVISAINGLGEKLVSGEEDGETWHVSNSVTAPDLPKILTHQKANDIADLARRAEAAFGCPQDIEWAIKDNQLFILQSRPITTPLLPEPVEDTHLTIFDNSNIVESYPGMVSPLTYSFAVHVYGRVYRAFVGILGLSNKDIARNTAIFGNMLGRVDGRVYYNLVNWYRALALLPGFALNRAYMETMMGVSTPMPQEVTRTIGPPDAKGFNRIYEFLKVAKVGFGLCFQAIALPKTRKAFYVRLNDVLESDFDIATASATDLTARYRHIESSLLDRWDAPLINDFLCMIAFGGSRDLLAKWLGPDGLVLHNDVMIGQGDIISAEPAQRIARMGTLVREAGLAERLKVDGIDALKNHPKLLKEVESYIEKFGDRCTEELKLESIPLSEDPSTLIFAVSASALQDRRPSKEVNEPDWKALFPRNPLKRVIAKHVVGWTKSRVKDRENLRFERTRIFGYARRVFLAIGKEFAARGLIETPRDVFFLTVEEVLGAVEGFGLSPNLKAIISTRKTQDAASALRDDPPERIEVRGPAIAPVWDEKVAAADTRVKQTATGCSAGTVTAKARVIRDPRTENLEPGDILVARHTDPGWIAVFSNASAIIVERGSLLSHSAIVARELGIPCVVGLKGATRWISNGERVTVNGATGEVERLDDHVRD